MVWLVLLQLCWVPFRAHLYPPNYVQAGFFDGFGGGFLPPFGQGQPLTFCEQYRCYSMVFSQKNSEEIKHGGKIIMPSSALEKLARLNISYPMRFKLTNTRQERSTPCGVREFVAEEGRIYVPHWVGCTVNQQGIVTYILPVEVFSTGIKNLDW